MAVHGRDGALKILTIVLVVLAGVVVIGAFWLWTPDRPRAELEAAYLADPGDLVDVEGVRLHVRDTGPRDAPALILLHGFGSSLHTFEPWAMALSDRYRVVRFDLPGTGLSSVDPGNDYTDARSLVVLGALMDRLGLDTASLAGNSMGGRIAWRFAAEFPTRVDKLVLISPDGFASAGFEYGKPPEVPAMVKLMRYVLPKAFLKMSISPAYADPSKLSDETVTRYHDLLLAPGSRDAMIARMGQLTLEEPAPFLAKITAPTLLLWGEKDAMIPVANAADYDRLIPDAEVVVLENVGHLPHEEAPELSLVPVATFLAKE